MESEKQVKLLVGNVPYTTTTTTLCSDPESMLARMIEQPAEKSKIARGESLFIDRDGKIFEYVLKYLRDGDKMVLPADPEVLKNLAVEADFFLLSKLTQLIRSGGPFNVGDVVTIRREPEAMAVKYLAQFPQRNPLKYICWFCQERFELHQTVVFSCAVQDYETGCFWGKLLSITDACAMVSFAVPMVAMHGGTRSFGSTDTTIRVHMPTVMLRKY